ncbi:MarR family winged helix-turn-helix transcriptional regulator [Luteipulveratus mongoliensis]|nr:MarR family winged helix-turn-helix transcriptional regulator [Luteipulveratus mongoliensis]
MPEAIDQPSVGVLCFIAHRAMETRVMEGLADAGFDDVTLAQSRVFQRIAPAGSRITDLAEQARVTKQTAVFLVNQLERVGYVERVADPTDARARLVRVAGRGQAAVAAARRLERQVEEEWTQHLGARDVATLTRILARLREVTDPYA